VPGKPVTDRRFRNTTVISNVLLITAALDILLVQPVPVFVPWLAFDSVTIKPAVDRT
jgi:hypothetical protein